MAIKNNNDYSNVYIWTKKINPILFYTIAHSKRRQATFGGELGAKLPCRRVGRIWMCNGNGYFATVSFAKNPPLLYSVIKRSLITIYKSQSPSRRERGEPLGGLEPCAFYVPTYNISKQTNESYNCFYLLNNPQIKMALL